MKGKFSVARGWGRPWWAAALLTFLFLSAGAHGQSREILIGAPVSITGKYRIEGRHVLNGYNLAIRQINRRGGITVGDKVYRLKLRYYDDGSDPATAAKATERLIDEDGVRFMLGPYSSELTREVQKVTEEYRMPLIQANGASRSLFSDRLYYHFGVLSPANLYLSSAVDFFAELVAAKGEDVRYKKAALIFEGDTFSQDVRIGVTESLVRHAIGIVVDERFPDDLGDISGPLQKVKEFKPDLLLVSGHSKGAATAARQIAELQVDVPMIAMTQCDSAQIEKHHPEGAEYVVCSLQWHRDLLHPDQDTLFGSGTNFVNVFERKYGYEPPYHSAESAAAVQVLVDAIRRADTLNTEAVRDMIAETDFESFFGRVKFDKTGSNTAKGMVLAQIIDGEYVLVRPRAEHAPDPVYPRPPWAER